MDKVELMIETPADAQAAGDDLDELAAFLQRNCPNLKVRVESSDYVAMIFIEVDEDAAEAWKLARTVFDQITTP